MDQNMKPQTTAKDFFVYLGTVILLYASFSSLLVLLFNYINYLFPDALTDGYYNYDPYSAAVRSALAVLIILFPVFYAATRYINKDLRAHPEKQEMPIRKWLLYLTVFLAACIVIGDLIILVNTFLNGEITMRFVLKVVTVLLLTGLALTYYVLDLKGKYIERPALGRMVGIIASLIVIATVIGGFFIIGSPQSQRDYRFDQLKINDLQNVQWQVLNYWQQKERMPMTLKDLEDPLSGQIIPVDKQTGLPYEYKVGTSTNFMLCATFNKASDDRKYPSPYYGKGGMGGGGYSEPSMYPYPPDGQFENWKHPAGAYCYDRKIDPERYKPYPKI